MAKRIKPAMLRYAANIPGAIKKNGRPDWYLVAEELAQLFIPELLQEDTVIARGPGRPKGNDDFFAADVHWMMQSAECGVAEACRKLSLGDQMQVPSRPGTRRYIKTDRYKGKNPDTLEQRYFRWLKREKERQQKLAIEIP